MVTVNKKLFFFYTKFLEIAEKSCPSNKRKKKKLIKKNIYTYRIVSKRLKSANVTLHTCNCIFT